ncbi:hypothetical protein KC353_g4500 [Hortaea werneckii]|nr:hypothetical protein KC353_g4500 [Hortaea werneckii]
MNRSTGNSTSRYAFASIFVLLAALAVREMRIGPVSSKVGEMFEPAVSANYIQAYDNIQLRKRYTGIEPVDYGLRFLVVAFLPGATGVPDPGQKLQQAYFLLSFFPVVAIMSVEAGRRVNHRTLIYFTSLWALAYQTVGGAIILALYGIAFLTVMAKAEGGASRLTDPIARGPSNAYAEALLPSLVLGYLLPTGLIYLPYDDWSLTQASIAAWQPAPLFVNLLLVVFTWAYTDGAGDTLHGIVSTSGGLKELKQVYALGFLVAAAAHWALLTICFLASDARLSVQHVLFPDWKLFVGESVNPTLPEGLLYIFQWDFLIIAATMLVLAYMVALDARGTQPQNTSSPGKILGLLCIGSIILGPTATVAAVWYWREGLLAGPQAVKPASARR